MSGSWGEDWDAGDNDWKSGGSWSKQDDWSKSDWASKSDWGTTSWQTQGAWQHDDRGSWAGHPAQPSAPSASQWARREETSLPNINPRCEIHGKDRRWDRLMKNEKGQWVCRPEDECVKM